jgi:GNAT superfamily N-acetyltransferase
MQMLAKIVPAEEVLPLRARHRQEMNCQIVHDSISRRPGWTTTYQLQLGGVVAGFGSVAIGGPWKGKPTIFEFYLLPEHRTHAFSLFDVFLGVSGARGFEVQSNEVLSTTMAVTYGRRIAVDKIVFQDQITTTLQVKDAILKRVTGEEEVLRCQEQRQGGGEWLLEVEGKLVGKGGLLFHYNRPYGDIYMEVAEPFRKCGFGSYLVQELKRASYQFGAVPCARCNPANRASRQTLQKAGFVPVAQILTASLR